MNSIENIVGKNIRRVRMARNLTQTDLAELIGRNQRTISNWEKGIRDPGSDNIRTIANVLEISPVELIGHNDTPADTDFQVIVHDNDMYPDIRKGDTLTVSSVAHISDGDIVIVQIGEELLCRKIYSHDNIISLLAINQKDGLMVTDDSEVRVVGRVMKVERKI